jgi:hypothetical protein
MGLQYTLLDDTTRALMLAELADDIAGGTLYLSPRLSVNGQLKYRDLLEMAFRSHDDDWLANQLRGVGVLNDTLQRKKPSGGFTTVKMPVNASETLAEGEFNRFYCRGICCRATTESNDKVIAYRAKQVDTPRSESQALIGRSFTASAILVDLRSNPGLDTIFGLPPGPNSGLSLKFP